MQLRYKYAVISHSPDLRDPEGDSFPVGVVLVGVGASVGVAAAASIPAHRLGLDPAAATVIDDLVRVVKTLVDEAPARRESGEASRIDQIIRWLHQSLRGSLFVSSVSGELEVELDSPNELSRIVLERLADELTDALRPLPHRDASPPHELDPGDRFFPVFAWPMLTEPPRDSHP